MAKTEELMAEASSSFDCIILGAGISGIDMAYHLQTRCPELSYAILERRGDVGGTWDFFRYPGIRSDSDMFTFGFAFKPWKNGKVVAPKEDIKNYLVDTANEFGIQSHIHFGTHVVSAAWSSRDNRWLLKTEDGRFFECRYLMSCMGYYLYDEPFAPSFLGRTRFPGRVIHPQEWSAEDAGTSPGCTRAETTMCGRRSWPSAERDPVEHDDTCYAGKNVAIIGSGATAVTLLPNIAGVARHVTMVQRTPTYIISAPEKDRFARFFSRFLPTMLVHMFMRSQYILWSALFYKFCKAFPRVAKKIMLKAAWRQVKGHMSRPDFEKHFTPPYNPWDQRLCLSPGGDFFASLEAGHASIVTGHIETFTEKGIQMKSGEHVDADVIITATGLNMQRNFPMSTMQVTVDGEEYRAAEKMTYRGCMLSGVPNFFFTVGYTNASWTLKADLISAFACRMLKHMKSKGYATCCPQLDDSVEVDESAFGGLSSGYVTRASELMPKQGKKAPWRAYNDYWVDKIQLRWRSLEDEALYFSRESESCAARL